MIVYVETNFILELAYLQEQHAGCEEILSFAETKQIILALPAFSVTEASGSRAKREGDRKKFHEQLTKELREVGRSRPYYDFVKEMDPVKAALIDSIESEKKRLNEVLGKLLRICDLLATQGNTAVHSALRIESTFGLEPNDAVILASILQDLANRGDGPKCFLNRNDKDFADPDIEDELKEFNCKLLTSFSSGAEFIRHVISKSP